MRPLVIVAAGVALATFAIAGSHSPANAQTPPTLLSLPTPQLGFTSNRTRLDATPAWHVDTRDREQRAGFRMHDRHSSWLFPRTAVAPFGSDPLQRRHWWADPLLRRHWWE